MEISKAEEIEYRNMVRTQGLEFRKEIESSDWEWAMDRRREYLDSMLTKTQKQLQSWKLACGRLAMKEKKEVVRNWLVRFAEMSPMPKQIEKLKKQIEWLEKRDAVTSGWVTQEMIERASAHPVERVIDPEELCRGKILCPFHSDKNPSMQIKNGFGYCYVCQKSMNAIHYLRMTKKLSFADAVRALQ